MDLTYAWAPITKSETQDDGTLMVYGPAASSALDRDQQRLGAEWLDRAMPEWAQTGNIREQHDAKRAVGVGVGLSKAEDGSHNIAAHIVDPLAVKKIQTGVLKGFSVGIKGPKVALGKSDAPGGEIVDGTICEISVVDRPCNPGTLFEIAKADSADTLQVVEEPMVVEKSEAEAFGIPAEAYARLAAPVKEALAKLAAAGAQVAVEEKADAPAAGPQFLLNIRGSVTEEQIRALVDGRVQELGKADTSAAAKKKTGVPGAAMADGSNSIASKADLRKAIKAVGRGADQDKTRKHIISRAKALGLEALVPTDWNPDGSTKTATKADEAAPDEAAAAEVVGKAEGILRDVRSLMPDLVKADETASDEAEGDSEAGEMTGSQQAISCIAKLIVADAEGLAGGDLGKASTISLLLDAVRSLRWFIRQSEAAKDGSDVYLADQPDVTKADEPTVPAAKPETPKTPEAAATAAAEVVTKADVAELVKSAVAEAGEAAEERMTSLAADLTKAQKTIEELQALPAPGGPALTRTSVQASEARKSDADQLRAEAEQLLTKANAVSDHDLRAGYLERRTALLAKADA
ncbi:hypothetical protein HY68_01630 [Streptomyces sp. AcH 505]|uniref:hypothetical protein n=1 Tax=Streptomyces sp. AcH 505 TaxID=352211 RepID=UPI000591E40F|nr:hypothetical protein HY68_01630 [Streptomyces sp. AcH 505]